MAACGGLVLQPAGTSVKTPSSRSAMRALGLAEQRSITQPLWCMAYWGKQLTGLMPEVGCTSVSGACRALASLICVQAGAQLENVLSQAC